MYLKILKQLGIILMVCLAAEAVVSLLPFTFPSSVMAILFLAFLLGTGFLKEEAIQETGDFMLASMALVFVPLAVGITEELEALKGQAAGFIIIVLISLVVTFTGTYGTVRLVQICMKKCKRGEGHE